MHPTLLREEPAEAYDVIRWDWERDPGAPARWPKDRRCARQGCFAHDAESCARGELDPTRCASWPMPRLVVCKPRLLSRGSAQALRAHLKLDKRSTWFVVPDEWSKGDAPVRGVIPAITVRAQADLDGRMCESCGGKGRKTWETTIRIRGSSGVGPGTSTSQASRACHECSGSGTTGGTRALLAVQAERRALVCSPLEEIDLRLRACRSCGEPVPEHPAKRFCARADRGVSFCRAATPIDLVIILGETGSGVCPMRPEHVDAIVRQCRAARVPVVCFPPERQICPVCWIGIGYAFGKLGDRCPLCASDAARDPIPWLSSHR